MIAELRAQVVDLQRRLAKDSSNSSKPPSSDNPFVKGTVKSSTRKPSGKRPGKQAGSGGSTRGLVDDPDEVIEVFPPTCPAGHDLAGVAPRSTRRRQVVDIATPPPPVVTEYQIHTVTCPDCGQRATGQAPAGVRGRVQYGPRFHALAAEVVCGHYLPIERGTRLIGACTGLKPSTGFLAGVRARAARLIEQLWLPTALGLVAQAPVVHVDETPARVSCVPTEEFAGGLRYVHIKTTDTVAVLHTGDRSKDTITEDGILEHYTGTLVRDGYAGYEHLVDADHAWCGAHLLRDLAAITKASTSAGEAEDTQIWASAMSDALLDALAATKTARDNGATELDPETKKALVTRYIGAYQHGLDTNTGRRDAVGKDAYRLATRFKDKKDLIFRFVEDLAVPFTNNLAERDLRPVKIQQRTSGGCWRTLDGLADFALVRSYLLTAAKNGIETLDALTRLFEHDPYLPAMAE